jgi:hypothetical protein
MDPIFVFPKTWVIRWMCAGHEKCAVDRIDRPGPQHNGSTAKMPHAIWHTGTPGCVRETIGTIHREIIIDLADFCGQNPCC